MEILDCFCGLGPWRSRDKLLPYTPQQTIELMDHFGIAQALVYSNTSADGGEVEAANRALIEATTGNARFIRAFVLAPHPHRDAPTPRDQIEAMSAAGAKAAWMWPQPGRQTHGLKTWLIGGLLEECARHRVPLFLFVEGIEPDDVHRICAEFRDLRVVLTGASYSADQWLFPLMSRHEHLYACLGHYYIPPGGPEVFLKHFPAERLLFGSGLPHFSPGGLVGYVIYADVDDATKEKILGGNLKRLLSEVRL